MMSKKIGILFIFLFLFSNTLRANSIENVVLGNIENSHQTLLYKGTVYPLYHFLDTCYIPVLYLEHMGASCIKEENSLIINEINKTRQPHLQKLEFKSTQVTLNPAGVYINNLATYSIVVEGNILIPIKVLGRLWQVREQGQNYSLVDKVYKENDYICINDTHLINTSSYVLRVQLTHLFWNGEVYVENKKDNIVLEPYAQLEKASLIGNYPKGVRYMTTLVTKINEWPIAWDEKDWYDQKNKQLFKTYDYITKVKALEKLFPAYVIKGRLKYNMASFKEGEQVRLWRTEARQYYVVINQEQLKVNLPWGCLDIEGDRGNYLKLAEKEQIEDYVTLKNITSKTNYILWTDVYRQRTYVLKRERHKWHLEKSIICSSGKNSSPTPDGFFRLEYSIPYIGMGKGYQGKNAMVFFRDYMYHSILFDSEGKYVVNGLYQLGRRVSHGCVRLSEEDSAWIYKHIPMGTTVWIH